MNPSPNKKSLKSLMMIMLFDHTCVNITFPVLTLIFFDKNSHLFATATPDHVRSLWYGLCISIPYFFALFSGPYLSMLSDTLGRRKILLATSLGGAALALSGGLGVLTGFMGFILLGRMIGGLISRTNFVAQAIVGDLSTDKTKISAMAYLQFAISIGAFIGPLIGGYFANKFFFSTLNFSLPFFIATAFGIAGYFITKFYFQESLSAPKVQDTKSNLIEMIKLLRNPSVLKTVIFLLISQLSWSLYYTFTPPILKIENHFDAQEIGTFVGLIALWLALTTGFLIQWFNRFLSPNQLMLISSYLVFTGLLITNLAFFYPEWSILAWVGAFPVAMGDVMLYTCITSRFSSAVSMQHQGKVMALCAIVVSIAWGSTGLLGGGLMAIHTLLPLWVAPLGIFVLIVLNHVLKADIKNQTTRT
jgi:DHA1 family tetracycline resistance protein-like MFS transporter